MKFFFFFILNCKAEMKLATNTEYLECVYTYVCMCLHMKKYFTLSTLVTQ